MQVGITRPSNVKPKIRVCGVPAGSSALRPHQTRSVIDTLMQGDDVLASVFRSHGRTMAAIDVWLKSRT